MPIRGTDSDGLRIAELLKIVEKYAEKGFIPEEELNEDLMLSLDYYKLAIPLKAEKDSLSWISRQFGGKMEIPYIVRFFFKFKDWKKAIEEYFRTIGEKNANEFVEIFEEISKKAKNFVICAEDIVEIALKRNRDPGVLISELKGSGLISPTVGCGGFGKAKAPLYELNRFFAMLINQ
ncbi:MAG: hypothetical protein QXK70_04745 [Archaeoglobaceae archaeon]